MRRIGTPHLTPISPERRFIEASTTRIGALYTLARLTSMAEDATRTEEAGTERDGAPADGTATPPADHWAPESGEAVADIFSTDEIFRRIVATADGEFSRSSRLLFFSGLAAGLIMSLSFLGKAVIDGELGRPVRLVSSLLYPLGFFFIVLGRYQLFTENTLTPVTLVLTRLASIPRLLHIWGLVFAANVLGTGIAALFFASTDVFGPAVRAAALDVGYHMMDMGWWEVFSKGVIAGWLVAGMVWLNHAARTATARVFIIFILMYTVGAADLAHCIVGSSEMLFMVFEGQADLVDFLWGFLAPATLGNTVGGVLLVALLNYAQTTEERFPEREVLPWRHWLLGSNSRGS